MRLKVTPPVRSIHVPPWTGSRLENLTLLSLGSHLPLGMGIDGGSVKPLSEAKQHTTFKSKRRVLHAFVVLTPKLLDLKVFQSLLRIWLGMKTSMRYEKLVRN